jgi:hypothetical protein
MYVDVCISLSISTYPFLPLEQHLRIYLSPYTPIRTPLSVHTHLHMQASSNAPVPQHTGGARYDKKGSPAPVMLSGQQQRGGYSGGASQDSPPTYGRHDLPLTPQPVDPGSFSDDLVAPVTVLMKHGYKDLAVAAPFLFFFLLLEETVQSIPVWRAIGRVLAADTQSPVKAVLQQAGVGSSHRYVCPYMYRCAGREI